MKLIKHRSRITDENLEKEFDDFRYNRVNLGHK